MTSKEIKLDLRSDRCVIPLTWRYLHVMIDVVERCNLTCTHCPFVQLRDEMETKARMSPALIEKLEREVFPFAKRATFSSFHEPLMAVDTLRQTIEAADRAGVQTKDIVTNAILLNEESATLLLKNMDLICLSVDGMSNETYAAIRRGATFDQFKEKVTFLSEMRRKLGLENKVALRFTACMIKSNIHEAHRFVEVAHDLGVDWVELRFAKQTTGTPLDESEKLCHIPEIAEANFNRARQRSAELGVGVTLPPSWAELIKSVRPRPRYTNCEYPWYTVRIDPKGGVIPCCLWNGKDDLGNISDVPFEQVWNGPLIRQLRWSLETSQMNRKSCMNCEVHYNLNDPKFWATHDYGSAEDAYLFAPYNPSPEQLAQEASE